MEIVQIRSFFWSVFSCIWTEYGDLLRKSLYSVQIQENADQKKLRIWTLFTQCDHGKYITTPEFNTMVASVFNARLAQADLVTKTDFDVGLKKISDRVTSNKSKHLLVENKLKKLEKFNVVCFRGKNYFDGNDGTQNYLVLQAISKYFSNNMSVWKSKGLFETLLRAYNFIINNKTRKLNIFTRC